MTAKIIGLRIYNNLRMHKRVRREVTQYLKCQHEIWGLKRKMPNYLHYLSETFSKLGEPFSKVEIEAAAKLYNIPIIFHKKVFPALTLEGNDQEPLYLHKRGMLVHKS